jgi:hypothetical protein
MTAPSSRPRAFEARRRQEGAAGRSHRHRPPRPRQEQGSRLYSTGRTGMAPAWRQGQASVSILARLWRGACPPSPSVLRRPHRATPS